MEKIELRINKDLVPAEYENALLAAGQRGVSCDFKYDADKEQFVFYFENAFKVFLFGMRYEQLKNATP